MKTQITVTAENTVKFPIHSHGTWEFMCYISGEGELITGNGNYSFTNGTIIAVPPGLRHGSRSQSPFVNICIHADIHMPADTVYYIETGTQREQSLFMLVKNYGFGMTGYESIIAHLTLAIKEIIIARVPANICNGEVNIVCKIITENFFDRNFNLSKAIKRAGYAEDYFRALFKKHCKIPPAAYLNKMRLDYAESLIKTYKGNLMIKEAAAMSGFSDALYFSRLFKKYKGVSPSELKRRET